MLSDSQAFSGFAVPDIEAAHKFYGETLGLETEVIDPPGILKIGAGGREIFVYPKPDFTPASYTILNFPVDDIDEAVDWLAGRGVEFERYDGFEQDEKGIARSAGGGPDIAWFTDPAGNILSVLSGDM